MIDYVHQDSTIRRVSEVTPTYLIKDFNEVYQTSKQFSTQWIVIALELGISKTTIDGIRERKELDSVGCMSEIISAWLKKDTSEQPPPTWKILCDAIAKVDSTAAEKIATDKGFDFMPSTGNNYICMCSTKINYNYSVAIRGWKQPVMQDIVR